jgi:hypothetical protein
MSPGSPAGIGADVLLPDETPDNIDCGIDVNLRSPMHPPASRNEAAEGSPAHIVFVGSLSGSRPPDHPAVQRIKFGLRVRIVAAGRSPRHAIGGASSSRGSSAT